MFHGRTAIANPMFTDAMYSDLSKKGFRVYIHGGVHMAVGWLVGFHI